jgi:hypothetical protein
MWEEFDEGRSAVGRPQCDETFLMADVQDGVVWVLCESGRRTEFCVELL